MKYGVLVTSAKNIGEEIQSLASLRFLPHLDYVVHRERTDQFHCDEKVSVIMNHWWLWEGAHFPPSEDIRPLFTSFHLQFRIRNQKFMNAETIAYFKKHAPIGCRDTVTADFLRSYGINAYFSGCLTTTLLPNPKMKHRFFDDYILCVDAPKNVVDEIKKRTDKRVLCVERLWNVCFSVEQRLELAKFMLFLYHNAHCVVTIALHAALPATAFGTPVCVIDTEELDAHSRFAGLEDCFTIVKEGEYLREKDSYDINNPPPNPQNYLAIRDGLVKTCKAFTEFDSESSIFEDDYNPIPALAQIMTYSEESIYKSYFYLGRKTATKAFAEKVLLNKSRHDVIPSPPCGDLKLLKK